VLVVRELEDGQRVKRALKAESVILRDLFGDEAPGLM